MIRKLLYFVRSLFFNFFNSSKERSFTPSLRLLCLGMFFVVSFANAATFTSVQTGDWNTPSTWTVTGGTDADGVPDADDLIFINTNYIITVSATTATCSSLTFSGSGTLNVSVGSVLSVINTFLVDSSNGSDRNVLLTGGGTLSCASLSVGNNANPSTAIVITKLTSTISNFNITGNLNIYSNQNGSNINEASYYLESGIVNVDGQITSTNEGSSNNSILSMATGVPQSGTLLLGNTTPFALSGTGTNTINLNGTNSVVNYDRAGAQTVYATAYKNLSLSGSGIKTFGSTAAIGGNLSFSGTATATFNTTGNTANTLTLAGNGQNSGTWGGTSTGAANILPAYFNSPTTPANKFVTISATSCATGYWTGTVSTNWATASNWCGNALPGAGTDVVIPSGTPYQPTIAAATTALCKNITINSSATLTLANSGTALLNINGDFTNNGLLTAGAASIISFVGTSNAVIQGSSTSTFSNLTINKSTASATVTNSNKVFAVGTDLTITRGNLILSAFDANYLVSGNLAITANGTLTHNVDWDIPAQAKQLTVGGNIALDGIYSKGSAGRSHVQMTGSGKTIHSGSSSFNILTLATSGTITADGNLTVDNNFWAPFGTAGGIFTTGNNIIIASGGLLVSNGVVNVTGGTLNITGQLYAGQAAASFGTVNISGGTVTTDGIILGDPAGTTASTINQTGGSLVVIGAVTINQPAASVTNAWNITASTATVSGLITFAGTNTTTSRVGKIAIATGTLNANGGITFVASAAGTKVIDMSGAGAGNLNLKGALTVPAASSTLTAGANSTFSYLDTGAQTVNPFSAGAYNHLTLSGSGNKTISAATTVSNNLTISGTAVLAPSAANLISDSAKLVLNGGNYTTGGFSETMGTLALNDNSTIALGAANHTINLAASNGVAWTSGKTLTITGWTGAFGSSGRIFVGNSATGLTTAQLAQIKFQIGAENRDTTILATGEIVPAFCPFASNVQSGSIQSICYDSTVRTTGTITGVVTFPSVPVDSYIAVNVIAGVQYRIASTITSKTFIKRLTLFNGSNTATALATTNASSATTAATIDWTANFTGVLYVVFNTANCQTSALTDDITVTYIGGSNNSDSQTAYGTDSWIGHVYNFSDSASVTPLSDTDAFASYLGHFTQANTVSGTTISFNNDYNTSTSTTTCFPFVAGSTPQSFYTETFAVKYRMRSSLTGCYLVNVDGDDGVRLTVDGVKILDAWVQQGITPYANVLIYLDATKNGGTGSELLFEHYEKNGNNISNFRMVPFDSSTNTIVAPTPATACSGVAPGLINGSTYTYNGSTVNPTIKFQWETATSAAGPWSNVTGGTGATAEDYTPGALTTTSNVTNYYRRSVSAVASNATSCVFYSNSIAITTSPTGTLTSPTAITGAATQCPALTNQIYTASLVTNATTYNWSVPTGWSITAGAGTNSITVTTGNAGQNGNISVTAQNGCSVSNPARTLPVTVNALPTVAAIAGGATSVCVNSLTPAFTDATTGGVWSITNGTGTATISSAGVVTGSTAGGVTVVYTVTSGGCSNTATTGLTINALPTVAAIAGGATSVCVGSVTPAFTDVTASGVWSITNGTGTASITTGGVVTGLSAGTVTVVYTVTSGGCSNNASVNLTVNPTPTAPTASVTTQPTCAAPTGTITVSSPSPAVGITYSIDGSDYSNTSGVFINVAPNITPYNVTVRNSSLCISPATSVTVNNPSGKVWNGSVSVNWATAGNWTPSGAPGVSDCVVIPSTVTKPEIASGATITVHSITVNSGGLLTVRPTGILTVATSVNVATGGDLVFEDDSSLLQTSTNSTINTGNITYKRISSAVRRYDFTFWSSPVTRTPTPYTLSDVSPLTLFDKYYSFSPATGWVISYSGILPMTSGLGYIIRAPQTYDINTAVVYPATFVGTPNNGTIVVTGANAPISGKSILIGNPYPSALNATTFINDNHNLYNVDIGALYFWTHNSPPNSAVAGDAKYNYTTADYAVFSLTGGVATSKAGTDTSNNVPTGIIAAGQAFFMKATSNKDVTFTNNMRVGTANDQFFKTAKANDEGKNRLWLNLTNAQGAFKQTLVGYLDGATNSWDVNYDGVTLNGNTFLDFYSINDTKRLTIQGRAMPFDNTDLVPLGYVSSIAGDFTIAIDHADGLFDTQPVYLEDKKAGKTVDLRAGDYTFTTAIGTFADRFVLSYVNKTLGTGDFENIENGLLVSVKDKSIKVTSAKETIKEVTIFDINGKLLYNKKKIGSSELQVSNLQAANQVLLVKVVLENGFTTTKKIVFQ